MKKLGKTNQISLFFFIFSIGCVITFVVLDLLFYSYNIKHRLMDNAIELVNHKEKEFIQSVKQTEDLLNSINVSKHFEEYQLYPNIFDNDINDIFLTLAKNDRHIMQLRYLDKNGMEQLRVDREKVNSIPHIVSKEKLQNKASRYYFKDSINKHNLWYSNLDLNMEHGKVEVPHKPTLRTMLPVKLHNEFNGILIVNYYMKEILDTLTNIPSHDLIIMNEKGFPLIHHEPTKNWGYYQNPSVSLKEEFKEHYDQIINKKQLKESDFVSKKIDFDLPEKLYFILKLNMEHAEDLAQDRYLHYFLVSAIILLLSLLMSTVFSRYLRTLFHVLKDAKSLNKFLNMKVKAQTKELEDSKEKLNNLIVNLHDFVWEVNAKGEYTYLSPQVEKILGYKPEELLGKTSFDLMPTRSKEHIQKIFFNLAKYGRPIEQLRNKNIHKLGHVVYLETSANPVFDEENNVVGYRGSNRDITQKVHDQQLLQENYKKIEELNENLEEQVKEEVSKNQEKDMQLFAQSKMAAMGDMIANIAHQWRQPLNAISTTASGIKVKHEFGQLNMNDLDKDMDIIVDKTQYLSDTINTFMNFLKEKKQFQIVDLKQTIQKSVDMVESSLHSHFITLHTNFDSIEDIEINTIPTELQEVLINILNNAKDAFKENNTQNRVIEIIIKKEDKLLTLQIEDNAGGIPPAIIDRIFEPYFTTKHESQGTGLGLHMSYRVITESLGGMIHAKNSDNGAIFIIELPL